MRLARDTQLKTKEIMPLLELSPSAIFSVDNSRISTKKRAKSITQNTELTLSQGFPLVSKVCQN